LRHSVESIGNKTCLLSLLSILQCGSVSGAHIDLFRNILFFTPPPGISPSVCVSVCLSASISLESLGRSARNFVCRSATAVARSSSDGVALRYVLPVLWTTLLNDVAIAERSVMSINACCFCVFYNCFQVYFSLL